jgi:hypothetical protein
MLTTIHHVDPERTEYVQSTHREFDNSMSPAIAKANFRGKVRARPHSRVTGPAPEPTGGGRCLQAFRKAVPGGRVLALLKRRSHRSYYY